MGLRSQTNLARSGAAPTYEKYAASVLRNLAPEPPDAALEEQTSRLPEEAGQTETRFGRFVLCKCPSEGTAPGWSADG